MVLTSRLGMARPSCYQLARQARRAKGTDRHNDTKNGTELANAITVAAWGLMTKGVSDSRK